MKLKIYRLENCDTCKKALQFLDTKKIAYEAIAIVEKPPTLAELKQMLSFVKKSEGTVKNLFNTSGVQYRELKVSDQFKSGLSETEALKLLSQNGKLIKRPFVLGSNFGLVGFKKEVWEKYLVLRN